MRSMRQLRDKLCEELDEIATKREMGAGDLEIVHKLTDTIKNIDKILMLEESGYSGDDDGMSEAYDRRSSYAGRHYVRGHYSRAEASDRVREELRRMMRDTDDDKTRDALRRCVAEMDK